MTLNGFTRSGYTQLQKLSDLVISPSNHRNKQSDLVGNITSKLLAVELLPDCDQEAFLDMHLASTHALLDESTQAYVDKINK